MDSNTELAVLTDQSDHAPIFDWRAETHEKTDRVF